MPCPNCNKNISIPNYAYRNLEAYQKTSVLVASECCGVGIHVQMRTVFDHIPYKGDATEDDWGRPIKHLKVSNTPCPDNCNCQEECELLKLNNNDK